MVNDIELSNMTDAELYKHCVQSDELSPLETELMYRLETKMMMEDLEEPDEVAWPEWMHEMIDESAGEQLPLFPDL